MVCLGDMVCLSSWGFISQGFLRDGGDSRARFVGLQPPLGEWETGPGSAKDPIHPQVWGAPASGLPPRLGPSCGSRGLIHFWDD